MADELVTLWRYRDLPEALAARAKLDSQAIRCVLVDDNIVRLDWFWSNAVGGVRLQVVDDEAPQALELLAEEIPESFSAEEIGEEYRQPACPKCGSRDISRESTYRKLGLLSLLILPPLALPILILLVLFAPIRQRHWKCEDCSHKWDAPYD